ncbi:hypothetical protein LG634_09035 [Streptomyces bambusae]|uniref:hypothetical protein n=1 Tax=Streptomyces bambusae TaxID=1550616 RepID=UPI001CFD4348|nr:hypothetical protein [Streptomyces bambusae]MCB5164971.1 hypothetical protein [Streptomyces bambusae]
MRLRNGCGRLLAITESPRTTRVILSPDEAAELDRLTAAVTEHAEALERARTALGLAAGRIASRYDRGGPAAVAVKVGWSRQHVSTLAAAHRAQAQTADAAEAA